MLLDYVVHDKRVAIEFRIKIETFRFAALGILFYKRKRNF
jgi:hypothetical protein